MLHYVRKLQDCIIVSASIHELISLHYAVMQHTPAFNSINKYKCDQSEENVSTALSAAISFASYTYFIF